MDRRLGLWVSALGGLLAVALVAAPIWDLWRYRRLRAPLGAHVPIGVILPLRTLPPPLPRRADAAGELPAAPPLQARASADRPAESNTPGGIAAAPALPAPPVAAPGAARNAADRPGPHRDFASPHLRDNTAASAPSLPAHTGDGTATDDATAKSTPAQSTGAEPSAAAGALLVWSAVPAQDNGPQLPPEPQQGPPPPSPATPTPSTGDPKPPAVAIPMLTLVPPIGPVAVGASFTVAVRLSGASNVTSLPFHVEFDPAVLQFQSAAQGSAIGAGMQPILLASVSPARPGDLAVGLSLVEAGGLLHGSGTVIRLQFRALAPGTSPLGFSRASIRGATSEALDAQFHDASINVR